VSRTEAELAAAKRGSTVMRRLISDENVGLHWVPRYLYPDHEAGLFDGDAEIGFVQWDNIGRVNYNWYVVGDGARGTTKSLAEAKLATEEAVKASWT
jgi:hypothetical protein